MITKLTTYLQSKCIPEVKFWVQQWVRDHIVDDLDPDDPDF
tara:strand:- start:171 stop:293 length:123 start_codon:yes stop_codon:yes gene_type:complete